jgi:hypothetical protein
MQAHFSCLYASCRSTRCFSSLSAEIKEGSSFQALQKRGGMRNAISSGSMACLMKCSGSCNGYLAHPFLKIDRLIFSYSPFFPDYMMLNPEISKKGFFMHKRKAHPFFEEDAFIF